MTDLKELLITSNYKKELGELIKISNLALKHWETYWTRFNSTYICEEILKEFENLEDFRFFVYGGYTSAQRSKIACFRAENLPDEEELVRTFPAKGIKIKGNFLFDQATQDDFRYLLVNNGLIKEKIGDIWTIGDRGAQGIINDTEVEHLNEKSCYLRDVKVKITIISLDELQIPVVRSKKLINTVEASTRLDAIASAGFRVSRNKILQRIGTGMIKLNGNTIKKSNINLKIGD